MSITDTVADKLKKLSGLIERNKSAVKQRHTYSGKSVDISQDILNITSKPLGQVITFHRKPYVFDYENGDYDISSWWSNLENNTVLGNGENPVICNSTYPFVIELRNKDNEKLYDINLNSYTAGNEWTETIIRFIGFEEELNLFFAFQGDDSCNFNMKFSTGDIDIKPNTITEFVMEYSNKMPGPYNFKLYRILVRYTNP